MKSYCKDGRCFKEKGNKMKKVKTIKCNYCKTRLDVETYSEKYSKHLEECDNYKEIERKRKEGLIDFKGRDILGQFIVIYNIDQSVEIKKVHSKTYSHNLRIIRMKNGKLRAEINGEGYDLSNLYNDMYNRKYNLPEEIMEELRKTLMIKKLKG